MISFFWNYTKSIEVVFKDEKLIRVYFTSAPICLHLDDRIKERFNKAVNRNSTDEKLTDLI